MSAETNARGITGNGDSKRSKRGSVDNGKRLAAFGHRGSAQGADWGGCDPRWIAGVIVKITSLGGACTFGLSRDGGAYSLTLLLDGDRQTLWFNGDADLDAELEKVYVTLETV